MSTDRSRALQRRWIIATVLPAGGLLALAAYAPILYAIALGFFKKTAFSPTMSWIGVANFLELLDDKGLWRALLRSLVFTVGSVGIQVAWGLFFALALNRAFAGRSLAKSLVIMPYLMPPIVVGLMFKWLLNPEFGILNQLLLDLGILERPLNFLGGLDTAMASVIGITGWEYGSFAALLLFARLQAINPRLYEAAKVSGAGPLRCFFDVTLPHLRSTLLIIALLRGIWMFNKFDLIWILTHGGPLEATQTLPIYAYRIAFEDFDFGAAAASCTLMFVVMAIGAWLYLHFFDPSREIEVGR
jgi:multiple sugar transport system permease protein